MNLDIHHKGTRIDNGNHPSFGQNLIACRGPTKLTAHHHRGIERVGRGVVYGIDKITVSSSGLIVDELDIFVKKIVGDVLANRSAVEVAGKSGQCERSVIVGVVSQACIAEELLFARCPGRAAVRIGDRLRRIFQ